MTNFDTRAKREYEQKTKAEIKKALKPYVGERTLISAREFWLYCVGDDKPIRWVKSYKTLLKYASENYAHIFKPKIKGEGSGTRYYIEVDNIVEFLYRFENNDLRRKD